VTWNVVRLTPRFERKALKFFLRLRDDPGPIKAYGAVMSGPGRYQMAGGDLQAPLLHVDWLPRLEVLAALGAGHDAVLTCRRTYGQAQSDVEARCVDLMLAGEDVCEVLEVLLIRQDASYSSSGSLTSQQTFPCCQQNLQTHALQLVCHAL